MDGKTQDHLLVLREMRSRAVLGGGTKRALPVRLQGDGEATFGHGDLRAATAAMKSSTSCSTVVKA